MNLDDLSVAVRERSVAEVFDLSLLLARRHAPRLALLALIGCAPCAALDWALLAWSDPDRPAALAWLAVLLIAQAPLATAPLTAYLGEAMFSGDPSLRRALASVRARFTRLLAVAAYRGSFAAAPVALFSAVAGGAPGLLLLVLLVFYPLHLVEVVLLERQPLRASLRRANQLMVGWRSEALGQLLVGGVLLAAGTVAAVSAGVSLVNLLFWGAIDDEAWWRWFHPAVGPLGLLAPWPFIAWLSVVRFLSYIDLRTRQEGWEIELDLRRAGRRIEPLIDAGART
jgi:hypothetical protein